MDSLPSVDLLRDHLVAHDRAVQEIMALDHYIEQIGKQTFLSTTGKHLSPDFQKMILISVAEGIKRMYKEYRLHKWLKVQEMATTVRRVIDAETGAITTGNPEQMVSHMPGPTSHQVLENSEVPIQKETESLNQISEGSCHNYSVLSDEVLDSVNVVNSHNHVAQHSISDMGQTDSALYSDSHLRSANRYVDEPVSQPQNFYQYAPGAEHLHPAATTNQPQQYGWPHQDDLEEPLDDSMDWESDASSYEDSEDELEGVLFATQHLRPEEQAVRLDVEMGDMGIGHQLFDHVSATWYTSHCKFYRTN